MHAYIPTYIHAYIHAYIYTHAFIHENEIKMQTLLTINW